MVMLPPEERLGLIDSESCSGISESLTCSSRLLSLDLKNRYEDVFAEFQRLPLRPETTCSLTAKADLTNALVEIERDIEFLEKHPRIFIVHNPSSVNK